MAGIGTSQARLSAEVGAASHVAKELLRLVEPILPDDPEAAGAYLHAWLIDAEYTLLSSGPLEELDQLPVYSSQPRPGLASLAADAAYCVHALQRCITMLLSPGTPAGCAIRAMTPEGAQEECTRKLHWPRAPDPSLPELHYPLAQCLLNACVDAPLFQAAAAYSAWSFAVCAAAAKPSPSPYWDSMMAAAHASLRANVGLLKGLDKPVVVCTLRSMHRMVAACPGQLLSVCMNQDGLVDRCLGLLAEPQAISPGISAAATHLLAGLLACCIGQGAHQMSYRLAHRLGTTPHYCAAVGDFLGQDFTAHYFKPLPTSLKAEAHFQAWACLLCALRLTLRVVETAQHAAQLAEAWVAGATVDALRTCLRPLPRVTLEAFAEPGLRGAKAPLKLAPGRSECLEAVVRTLGCFVGHPPLLQQLCDEGMPEQLLDLFCTRLPRNLLDDAALVLGAILNANQPEVTDRLLALQGGGAVPDLIAAPLAHLGGHVALMRQGLMAEQGLCGAPYAVCMWTKHVNLGSSAAEAYIPALVDYALSVEDGLALNMKSMWYALGALCRLAAQDAFCREILQPSLDRFSTGCGALLAALCQVLAGEREVEGEFGDGVVPRAAWWSTAAGEFLAGLTKLFSDKGGGQELAMAMVQGGVLSGTVRLLEAGKDSRPKLTAEVLQLVLRGSRLDRAFKRSLQGNRPALDGALRMLGEIGEAARRRRGDPTPPSPGPGTPLLELVCDVWHMREMESAGRPIIKHGELVKALVPGLWAVWDSALRMTDLNDLRGTSGARGLSWLIIHAIVDFDILCLGRASEGDPPLDADDSQLALDFQELCRALQFALQMENGYGEDHFGNPFGHHGTCKRDFAAALGELLDACEYLIKSEWIRPSLVSAGVPQELYRAQAVIQSYLWDQPWAPALRARLRASMEKLGVQGAGRKGKKKGSQKASEAQGAVELSAQDLAAAEAAALAAEAALLAELEREELSKKGKAQAGLGPSGKKKGKKKKSGAQAAAQPQAKAPVAAGSAVSEPAKSDSEAQAGSSASELREPDLEEQAQQGAGMKTGGGRGQQGGQPRGAKGGLDEGGGGGGGAAADPLLEGYQRMMQQLQAGALEPPTQQQQQQLGAGPSAAPPGWQPASEPQQQHTAATAADGQTNQAARRDANDGPALQPAPAFQEHAQPAPSSEGLAAPAPGPRLPPTPRGQTQLAHISPELEQQGLGPGPPPASPSNSHFQALLLKAAAAAPRPATSPQRPLPLSPLRAMPLEPGAPGVGAGEAEELEMVMPWLAVGGGSGTLEPPAPLPPPQQDMAVAASTGGGSSRGQQSSKLLAVLSCPLTKARFSDPVIATDGHSYERAAIVAWLAQQPVSPLTGEPLSASALRPNHALRMAAEAVLE